MRNLSNEDLEWLGAPDDSGSETRLVHIQGDFAIGTDGYRLHAINLDKIDNVEGVAIKKLVDKFNDNVAAKSITINPRFLIDALAGMTGYFRVIELSISADMIKLESGDGKTAIIMRVEVNNDESD